MGSLANQYISQSYTSLIHLGNDTTASATLTELQDGLGNGLGISVNTLGDISASNTITTNNLVVNNSTELTGIFDLDTYFSASTPSYINSTQPFFTDTVYVTGSYQSGTYPPSIADVQVGWIGNGINVTNGLVTAVSQSIDGYYITMAGEFPQIAQSYTFTGGISPTAKITGSLEVSENLIISGTFDIEGKVTVNDNVRINGNLEVSGSQINTGSLFVSNEISSSTINGIGNVTAFSQSLWAEFNNIENYTSSLRAAFTASGVDTIFTNNITASNIEVRNNLNVVGTLTASKVVTLIESSSIIYSSGSNILGDETSDTQTLVGDVIMSGSASLTGSMGISNDLNVIGNISSSTISGIGNVTTFSQSVDSRLDFLEGPFSTSVDSRLDELESFSSSLVTDFVNTSEFNSYTQSTNTLISTKLNSSSFNSYTSSTNGRLNNLESTTASLNISVANLNAFSASIGAGVALLTGSQSFVGNQTITGSLILSSSASTELTVIGNSIYTGSVRGNLNTLSVVSTTASFDCNLGNFFTLNLPASVATNINPININPGQTISLRIIQNATPGTVTYPLSIKFPSGSLYTATQISGAVDILTFISYDTNTLFATRVKNMI
jgi:cytoskeletal protein CcmA (bactofilin family)